MSTGFGGRKTKGNCPIGRPRRRWEDNFKIHIKEFMVGSFGLNSCG